MRGGVLLVAVTCCCLAAGLLLSGSQGNNGRAGAEKEDRAQDWREDWAVADGFSISKDADGFKPPGSIAFVPQPGPDPKDPLYFVAELRGAVKVVTNDRSVYTFADDFFELMPQEELPSGQGQVGMAGICLAPEHGYVFVTFAYEDATGILRNNIVRFEAHPQTLSRQPTNRVAFTEVFDSYETGLAHHIGNCQVEDGHLFVGVGEAWQPLLTQQLDYMHGKVLRMTLDGKPVPQNPFYEDDDVTKARNFVYAYGLRNPFSLSVVQDGVFVADNGAGSDRFIRLNPGTNYLWDGTDESIAANADYYWAQSIGPVQMDYAGDMPYLPEAYRRAFYVARSANTGKKTPGITLIHYAVDEEAVLDVPRTLVDYQGGDKRPQMITGLAFGPDGLYFTPLLPDKAGETSILKLTYDPSSQHAHQIEERLDAQELIAAHGCNGCHTIDGNWGFGGGTAGPPLNRGQQLIDRIEALLASNTYKEQVRVINQVSTAPQASYRQARQQVLNAEGEEQVYLWLTNYLQEPRFDRRHNVMPNLGLSEEEAYIIADYLMQEPNGKATAFSTLGQSRRVWIARHFPMLSATKRLLAAFLAIGVLAGGTLVGLVYVALQHRRRATRR